MKNYEIKPTPENLIKYYQNDIVDRNQDVFEFVSLLNEIEDSVTISLDGKWGCGKTFFVKHVQMVLDSINHNRNMNQNDRLVIEGKWNEYNKQGPSKNIISVYFDAWEHDDSQDPLLSLMYEIIVSINSNYDEGLLDLGKILDIAASVACAITGVDFKSVINTMNSESIFNKIKEERSIRQKLDSILNEILKEYGEKIVIFVDELDRCRPSFAIQLLERIKHYFGHDKLVFVFSINAVELCNVIKHYYGAEFDAATYLDKFFVLRMELPFVDKEKYLLAVGANSQTGVPLRSVIAISKILNFEMREMCRYIQKLNRIVESASFYEYHNAKRYLDLTFFIPILVGLSLKNPQQYSDFIAGKGEDFLKNVVSNIELHSQIKEDMLNANETYDMNFSKKVVTIEQKMVEVYKALFVQSFDKDYLHKVGKVEYYKDDKNALLKMIGAISKKC